MKKLLLSFLLIFSFSFTQAQIITAVAGNATAGFSGDGGQATAAELHSPIAVAFDTAGNMYIADNGNERIRKVNTSGVITTFAGTGTTGFSGDGGQATSAEFNGLNALTCDVAGNIYVVDYLNYRVRKISTAGVITTVAGNGSQTYIGDGVQATNTGINPNGVAIDTAGDIFITDAQNQSIRKINALGYIYTIGGTGTAGYNGDGGLATDAAVNTPSGIYSDARGDVYFADTFNNAVRGITKFSGKMQAYAGDGIAGYNGEHIPALNAYLNFPSSVVIDTMGDMYITDQANGRIRIVNHHSDSISTAAGNGSYGLSGDGGISYVAELASPRGIAINHAQNLFIADFNNNLVRMVSNPKLTAVNQLKVENEKLKVYPNPGNGTFGVKSEELRANSVIEVYNILGEKVYSQFSTFNSQLSIDLSSQPGGIYFLHLVTDSGSYNTRLEIVK